MLTQKATFTPLLVASQLFVIYTQRNKTLTVVVGVVLWQLMYTGQSK